MTQKEKLEIIIKKIAIMDDHMDYMRSMIERLEDRVISLEDQIQSEYTESRDVVFESDWRGYNGKDDDDDDDNED
jgi:Mg2+ and Co2+ transporter CorA